MTEMPYADMVAGLRAYHASLDPCDLDWRRDQLEALRAMVKEEESGVLDALHTDLRKTPAESRITETDFVIEEIDHALSHLDDWARPAREPTPIFLQPGSCQVVWEPLGVVLIIGTWNYPFHLMIAPLVASLAAGNAAVLKPSEIAPATADLIADIVPRYLDSRAVVVVAGGVPETTALLEQRFDRIFFTGSGRVGRIVMAAAAKHLTPVTLELGGKSPCIVDASAKLGVAARRIAFGKFSNAGQTCLAPDYVLVHRDLVDDFVSAMADTIRDFYGPNPQQSEHYARVVNGQHHARLVSLLNDGEAVVGGEHDAADLYVAPTLLRGVDPSSPVMQEEIFGPILPVLEIEDADEAIQFVNERGKPLALYVFAEDDEVVARIIHGTSSGGVCINDTVAHSAAPDLPFGGVGESGMGKYHGEWGFREFSNAKAVLSRSTWLDPGLHYPPYTATKTGLLGRMRG